MSHQLVQKVVVGIPQDRMEVLRWTITLVRGSEEHDSDESPELGKEYNNSSQGVQWLGSNEPQ